MLILSGVLSVNYLQGNEISIDFYFVCDKCKVGIHVAQTGMSGFVFYSGEKYCMKKFSNFLEDHVYHDIRFVDESKFYELVEENVYAEIEWKSNE